MAEQWKYQIRITLGDAVAEAARRDPGNSAIAPLAAILAKHHATLKCQFDAFADYVTDAERHGTEKYPLYAWTKATIENGAKKKKYVKSFTLYVEGEEVYAKTIANALEFGSAAARRRHVHHRDVQVRHQPRKQPSAAAECR